MPAVTAEPALKSEPANPKQGGADERKHHVVRRPGLAALAEHDRAHKPGDAGVDMHDGAAGEIEHFHPCGVVAGREDTVGSPDPMCNRRVDENRPQANEPEHGRELHALGKSAGNQRRGNDGERHLEADVHAFRDGRGERIGVTDTSLADVAEDVLQEHAIQAPDKGRAGAKRHAVGDEREEYRDEAGDRKAGHHRVADVLLAHHAAIEQSEARDCHHQYKRDRRQHPGGVAGIGRAVFEDLAAAGRRSRVFRESDVTEQHKEKRDPQESNYERYESLARVCPGFHRFLPVKRCRCRLPSPLVDLSKANANGSLGLARQQNCRRRTLAASEIPP